MRKITKQFKEVPNKILATLMMFGMLFQIFAPTIVLATTFEDGNTVTIGGNSTINGNTFAYENGSVTITKNNVAVNQKSFTVEQDDEIRIELIPADGYIARLHNEVQDYDVQLANGVYEFKIGQKKENTISLTPSFSSSQPQEPPIEGGDPQDQPVESLKFDFTINGVSFTDVSIGDAVAVSNDFNMDALEEFYVTKIITGERTYTYSDNEYSYDLKDNQNKHIFEAKFNKISNNYVNLKVIEVHLDDMLDEDIAENKTRSDYFGFVITGIKFIKSGFKGVEVSTGVMPDNYDFTMWNGVDLSATTANKPGTVTAYYGEDTISLNSSINSGVKKIELIDGFGVPDSAVEINNSNSTIKVLSNYYNQIPVKIELEDGTIGYITINRIGLFIGDLNKGMNTFYHGAFNSNVEGKLDVETDKQRLVAVFYHENETTYEDYDLIVNITYKNGTTEVKTARGVGDVDDMDGNLVGSDYILWSGDSLDIVEKVSVTAVKKGATDSKTTFGGAAFGSGSGVVWENREGGIE